MKKSIAAFLPVLFMGFLFGDKNDITSNSSEIQFDGPYVQYKNGMGYVYYIDGVNGTFHLKVDSFPESKKEEIKLKVATDKDDVTFEFALKKNLKNEKTDFSDAKKIFVISDIEGEFKAFRQLLQANGIIDDKFNWTFGEGHLVLTGDFVDRGTMVTEVLWLIYSLEEKAEDAGGYVHFVLGNHEIMNLNNDLRYVHPKYMESARLMNVNFLHLIGENAELGRWLRTKNIMEKVGNVLFMHAGVSAQMNHIDLSLNRMNKLARPYYDDTSYNYKNPEVELIYSDLGPFWYRGYYYGTEKASIEQIDKTLSLYKVKHIATGHTVIADTISILFDGKLINTDVHHSKGKSEGLLIEKGNFYRANANGDRFKIL